ncbi:MAG: hypothetical protein HFK10_01625 [Clostridia bacterium]|nr:hypothetical protein [Clostridia bacterium]
MRIAVNKKPKCVAVWAVVFLSAVLLAMSACMALVSARADEGEPVVPPIETPVEKPNDVTIRYNDGISAEESGTSIYQKTKTALQKTDGEKDSAIVYEGFTVTLGVGTIADFKPVDTVAGDTLKAAAVESNVAFHNQYVFVQDPNRHAIVKVTLNEGVTAKVSMPKTEDLAMDWQGNAYYYGVHIEHDGKLQTVARKKVNGKITADGDAGAQADFDGAAAHLTGGDSFYFVLHGDTQYQHIPDIIVSQADYDATAENAATDTITVVYNDWVGNGNSLYQKAKVEVRKADAAKRNHDLDYDSFSVMLGVAPETDLFAVTPMDTIGPVWDSQLQTSLVDQNNSNTGDPGTLYFSDGAIRVYTASHAAVIKVTAKADAKIAFDPDATKDFTFDWCNAAYEVYAEHDGVILTVAAKKVGNTDVKFDGASAHLVAGDNLYLVIHANGQFPLVPNLTVSQKDYDENERLPFDKIAELKTYDQLDYTADGIAAIDKIIDDAIVQLKTAADAQAVIDKAKTDIAAVKRGKAYKNAIGEIAAAPDRDRASNSLLEYAVGYGTATDFQAFPSLSGDQLKTPEDFACCFVSPMQMRATPKVGKTILRFTAKEQAELVFDFTFEARGWSYESIIGVYASRGDVMLPLEEKTFPTVGEANRAVKFEFSIHAEIGDTVTFVMTGGGEGHTLSVVDSEVTEGTFDENKVLPYEKADAILALVDRDDYTTKQWAAVQATMLAYIDKLGAAEDDAAAEAVVEEAKTKIGNMTRIYATADVAKYTAAQWTLVEAFLAGQVEQLDEAGSDVETIVSASTTRIENMDSIFALAARKHFNAAQWIGIEKIFAEQVGMLAEGGAIEDVLEATRTAVGAIPGGADYVNIFTDVSADATYAPVEYAKASFGLYASETLYGGALLLMNGRKANGDLYYTTSDKPSDQINIDGDCAVAFSKEQVITHAMYAVVALTAKENLSVTITTPQVGDAYKWTFGDKQGADGEFPVEHPGVTQYYIKNFAGATYMVKYTTWVYPGAGVGDYGYTAHLRAGETLYYVLYDNWASINLIPTFTFGEYDETWDYEIVHGTQESYGYPSMVSTAAKTDGEEYKGDLVNWQFLYGEDLDSLQKFDSADLGAMEADNMLYVGAKADPSCFVKRWQWRVSNPNIVALRFTANVDCYIDPFNPLIELSYVAQAYVRTVVENEAGIRITRKTYVPKVKNQEGAYFNPEHLKAGDTLYIILEPIERNAGSYPHTLEMTGVAGDTVKFNISVEAYDETLRADYAAEERLIAYRAEKAQEIKDYVAAIDLKQYSMANRMLIQEYAANIVGTLERLDSIEKIDEAVASVKATIDGVKTIAQEAEELAAYKTEMKAAIAAYANQADYTTENWAKVSGYVDTAIKAIDAAKSKSSVDTAVKAAQNRIDKVPKGGKKGCGCGSAAGAGGGIVLAAALLGAAVILTLRKKKITERK